MSFQDKTLECYDCGNTFTFSAEEQEQFRSRGYTNEPKRCPECRQARKARQYGNSTNSYGNDKENRKKYTWEYPGDKKSTYGLFRDNGIEDKAETGRD